MKEQKPRGQITVNVIDHDRLKAITNLSIAIRRTAEALSVPAQVTITGCVISNSDPGIFIKTIPEEKRYIETTNQEEP